MNITLLKQCANCGACLNACPVNAISIKEDGLFYTPVVDERRCVDCGICVASCPIQSDMPSIHPLKAVAGWHKQADVVLGSSSGGMFYGLAQTVLSDGGVVFAAAYSQDCKTVIFTSTDAVSLDQLQKSKYVESAIGDAFRQIFIELEKDRRVLFCGTPCQVAGLRTFLKKDYEKLTTCDFACGGLPSHKIYRAYLSNLEQKYGSVVTSVDFRPKTHGWKRYAVLIDFQNCKRYLRLGVEDPYLRSFLYGKKTVRDYCMDCKFAQCHASDLTIADFWMHRKLSELENFNGISLILCNTQKGIDSIEQIKQHYLLQALDVQSASYNNQLSRADQKTRDKRNDFLRMFEKKGLDAAYDQTFKDPLHYKIRNLATRILRYKRRGR